MGKINKNKNISKNNKMANNLRNKGTFRDKMIKQKDIMNYHSDDPDKIEFRKRKVKRDRHYDLLCPIENYLLIKVSGLDLLLLGESHDYACNPYSFMLRNVKKMCEKYNCVFVEQMITVKPWSQYYLPKILGARTASPLIQVLHEVENSIISDPREEYYRHCISTFNKETGTDISRIMPDMSIGFNTFCDIQYKEYSDVERRHMVYVCLKVLHWINANSRQKTKETMVKFFKNRKQYVSDKLIKACMKAISIMAGYQGSLSRGNTLDISPVQVQLPGKELTSHIPMDNNFLIQFVNNIDEGTGAVLVKNFINYFIDVTVLEHTLVYNIETRNIPCTKALGFFGASHLYSFASVCKDFYSLEDSDIKIHLTKFEPDVLIREMENVGLFDAKKETDVSWGEWFVDQLAKYNFIDKAKRLSELEEKNEQELVNRTKRHNGRPY